VKEREKSILENYDSRKRERKKEKVFGTSHKIPREE